MTSPAQNLWDYYKTIEPSVHERYRRTFRKSGRGWGKTAEQQAILDMIVYGADIEVDREGNLTARWALNEATGLMHCLMNHQTGIGQRHFLRPDWSEVYRVTREAMMMFVPVDIPPVDTAKVRWPSGWWKGWKPSDQDAYLDEFFNWNIPTKEQQDATWKSAADIADAITDWWKKNKF